MTKLKALVLISLLMTVVSTGVHAQTDDGGPLEPLILTDDQEDYPLGLHMDILEDPSGELTIVDVASREFASRFTRSQDEVPVFGFTDGVYWVRLRLRNEAEKRSDWWLEASFPNIFYVDLYTPRADGEGYEVAHAGVLRPLNAKDIPQTHPTFKLFIPNQTEQTSYLRFESGASMSVGLTLWTPDAFLSLTQRRHLWLGMFFGLMIGLLAYNLFLLLVVREANYLYLVSFLAFMVAHTAVYQGYAFTYLLPPHYDLVLVAHALLLAGMFISIVLFTDGLLELKERLPQLHRLNLAVVGVWLGLVLLIPFASYRVIGSLMVPWAVPTIGVVLVAGIIMSLRGLRTARFFLLAWLGALAGIAVTLLVRWGTLPSTPVTEYGYLGGVAIVAVVWSNALADRINYLKEQSDMANRDLRQSEHRLAEILEGLPLGVVVYGVDQKPSFVNKRVFEILGNVAQGIKPDLSAGRTLAEAMKYFSFRTSGTEQDYPIEKMPVYRALRGQRASADDLEVDLVDRRTPLEMWASPVINAEGSIEAAVVAFQDITERNQRNEELRSYRQHLEALVVERTAALTATNEQLGQEILEREAVQTLLYSHNDWLADVVEARHLLKGTEDLPRVYAELSASLLHLIGAAVVFRLRYQSDGKPCHLYCHPLEQDSASSGPHKEFVLRSDSPLRQDVELGRAIRLSAERARVLPAPLVACYPPNHWQSLILVPLVKRPPFVDVWGVVLQQPLEEITPGLDDLITHIVLDLDALAEDAQLHDQARQLAATEERNRLARDLHDSVTQVLFSASLVAEVLPRIWRHNPQQAMESLEELRRLTRGALAEMRTMLLELRPASLVKSRLGELLAQLAEATTCRTDLPFQLFFEQVPLLPERVQVTFYRVAQEALNNVVKHARANRVTLRLSANPMPPDDTGQVRHRVELEVSDDGVGFDAENPLTEHLGLGIMRERAAAIAADLSLHSRPGKGTRVMLAWYGELKEAGQ